MRALLSYTLETSENNPITVWISQHKVGGGCMYSAVLIIVHCRVMLIEYLVGNNYVIWSLSQAACLLDSIGYPISDIRNSDNGSLLIGHITYMY